MLWRLAVAERHTRTFAICIHYEYSNTARDPSTAGQFILPKNRTPTLHCDRRTVFPIALHDTKLLLQTVGNVDCSIIVLFERFALHMFVFVPIMDELASSTIMGVVKRINVENNPYKII